MLGELVDRIAAIEQDALVTIDIGDLGFARRRGGEARIVGEDLGFAVKARDIDDIGADRSVSDRKVIIVVSDREGGLFGDTAGGILGRVVHVRTLLPFPR